MNFSKITKNLLIFFTFYFYLFPITTHAEAPIAVFKDWTVFTTTQNNKEICYIASLPFKKDGNYKSRGEPFLTVTRIFDSNFDEVNVSSGYPYKKEKDVEISIGKRKFVLFSHEEKAWAYNRSDDMAIVEQMKKGVKLKVTGYSQLETYSTDTYSLLGFTEAYEEMLFLCKPEEKK